MVTHDAALCVILEDDLSGSYKSLTTIRFAYHLWLWRPTAQKPRPISIQIVHRQNLHAEEHQRTNDPLALNPGGQAI